MALDDIVFADGDIQTFLLEITDGIMADLNAPLDIVFDDAAILTIPPVSTGGGEHSFTFG